MGLKKLPPLKLPKPELDWGVLDRLLDILVRPAKASVWGGGLLGEVAPKLRLAKASLNPPLADGVAWCPPAEDWNVGDCMPPKPLSDPDEAWEACWVWA